MIKERKKKRKKEKYITKAPNNDKINHNYSLKSLPAASKPSITILACVVPQSSNNLVIFDRNNPILPLFN